MTTDTPSPVDLIFVLAGRMDRKPYGLELFRAGMAPVLVLSVGRFEVSRMGALGLDSAPIEELIRLRDHTPAEERHFFLRFDRAAVAVEQRRLARWNTYGEILELRKLVEAEKARRVMIVSTDLHLRRIALACRRVFRGQPVNFLYCPVLPAGGAPLRFVLKEALKFAGYALILALPAAAGRRLMRLRPPRA